MSLLSTLITSALRRSYSNPAIDKQPDIFQLRRDNYSVLWAYYSNELFDTVSNQQWAGYRVTYNLYRGIRSIYNPTKRGVDFYAANVWPGVLSEDGQELPENVSIAVPFGKDTDPKLKDASAQLWRWWNFQAVKANIPRTGAALGSAMVELVDDVEKGKVLIRDVWPGDVVHLDLDHAGNIRSYAVEYYTSDDSYTVGTRPQPNVPYLYRKEVDKESFRYYKNGQPFDYYGNGAVEVNPYGFVPARWFKHKHEGGPHGVPFIAGSQSKIDELNALASQLNDYIAKAVEMPKVLWSSGKITALGTRAGTEQATTTDLPRRYRDKETVNILTGPPDGHVDDLITSFDVPGALGNIEKLTIEIEKDHPELTFYEKLRGMSSVTGPAVRLMMGDTENLLQEISANYDQGLICLIQMAIAMAGLRLSMRQDGWSNPTEQQLKFANYDLSSYQRGALDMEIMPRSLIKSSKLEQSQERMTYWQSIKAEIDAGIPIEIALQDDWTPEQLAELKAYRENQVESQLAELEQVKAEKLQLQTELAGGGGGNAVATAAGANSGMKDVQPMMQGGKA